MIAALITRGHHDAYMYGIGFSNTVIEFITGVPARPEADSDPDDNEEKMKEVFGGR